MTAIYAAYLTVTVLGTLAAAAILLAIIGIAAYAAAERFTSLVLCIGRLIDSDRNMTNEEREAARKIIRDVKKRIRERKHPVTKPENEIGSQEDQS